MPFSVPRWVLVQFLKPPRLCMNDGTEMREQCLGSPFPNPGLIVAYQMSELTEERALVRPISRKLRLDLLTQRIVLVVVFVGVWWLSSLSVPHYILPGPARVWEALQLIVRNGDLWSNLGITFWR